jgi:N-terminal domain on NACHT_NTPase and P-loop NTPases
LILDRSFDHLYYLSSLSCFSAKKAPAEPQPAWRLSSSHPRKQSAHSTPHIIIQLQQKDSTNRFRNPYRLCTTRPGTTSPWKDNLLVNDLVSILHLSRQRHSEHGEAVAAVNLAPTLVQFVTFTSKILERLDDFESVINKIPADLRDVEVQLLLIIDALQHNQRQLKEGRVAKTAANALKTVIERGQKEAQAIAGRSWKELCRKMLLQPSKSEYRP